MVLRAFPHQRRRLVTLPGLERRVKRELEMPLETGPQLQDLPIRPADHCVVDVEDEVRRGRAPRAGAAERLAARNCKVPDCCEAGAHPGFRVPQHCYHVENPSPRSATPGGRVLKVTTRFVLVGTP